MFAAPTDDEARYLKSSAQQSTLSLRRGQPIRLPPPVAHFADQLDAQERAILAETHAYAITGVPETVRHGVGGLIAQTGANEIMVSSPIYDHAARLRSYAILAEMMRRS